MRFVQTGFWSGTGCSVGDEHFEVTPDRWKGVRDRSWGIRPVGETEPAGHPPGNEGQLTGMWNYAPMQFDDHAILYIVNETNEGQRVLEEAVRIWTDPSGASQSGSGDPSTSTSCAPGTRIVEKLDAGRSPRRRAAASR